MSTRISQISERTVEGSADLVTHKSRHQSSPMVDREPRDAPEAPCTNRGDMYYTYYTGWCSSKYNIPCKMNATS